MLFRKEIIKMQVYNDEIYHYGKLGMKWGYRKTSNTIRSKRMLTKKRQLEADKKTLDNLNNGGHMSVGLTKKRQEAYDVRDKAMLKKRISKNTDKLSATPKAKLSATPKADFSTKRKAAMWTAGILTSIGTKTLADHVLLNRYGVDGISRFVASTLAGSLAGKKVVDLF